MGDGGTKSMNKLLKLWEIPTTKELYMIVGWNQWADAGSISSGLPRYLIKKADAQKIGGIYCGRYRNYFTLVNTFYFS